MIEYAVLGEIAALKAAEAHLLQVFHLHEPCAREEHLRGLPKAVFSERVCRAFAALVDRALAEGEETLVILSTSAVCRVRQSGVI